MLIRMARKSTPKSSEITPKDVYLNRRKFIAGSGLIAGSAALGMGSVPASAAVEPPGANPALSPIIDGYSKLGDDDPLTPYTDVASYNNFYEFGTGKGDPVENAGPFNPKPWEITVDGMCANPGTIGLEDFLKPHDLEERIYRLRCVEAWSMDVPWSGFGLKALVEFAKPLSNARYLQMASFHNPEVAPGQKSSWYPWPYIEGITIEEATNELAFIATGAYGKPLPKQNGSPLRLTLPWKYGFKSIKSIVRITLTDKEPPTSWNKANAREYGFYSNVNPEVSHPRWSQASERPIGGGLFAKRKPTLMFNGYEEEVASLYKGMDLSVHY